MNTRARQDFKTHLHEPAVRKQRWHAVTERSRALGELLLSDVESGAIARKVQPI